VKEGPSSISLAASGWQMKILRGSRKESIISIRNPGRIGRQGPGIVVVEGGCCRQE